MIFLASYHNGNPSQILSEQEVLEMIQSKAWRTNLMDIEAWTMSDDHVWSRVL